MQASLNSIECLNDCNMPSDLADVIYDSLTNSNYLLRQAEHLYLLAVDPDGDNQTDYLLMLETNYLVVSSPGAGPAEPARRLAASGRPRSTSPPSSRCARGCFCFSLATQRRAPSRRIA